MYCHLATMAFVAACAVPFASVRAVDFPQPASFNPTWESANPGTCRDRTIPTGALLGNGALGVVNGGDRNHKEFVLTRGDIWSCGDFTCGKADHHVRPISFADFSIGPGMHSVKSTDTLDLPTATLRTEGGFGKGRVKIETYVASTEDLLVVTGVSDTDDNWAVHLTAHRERKPFPIEVKSSKEAFYVRRSTINLLPQGDPRGWMTNATAALSVLGTELENFSVAGEGHVMTWAKIRANVPFAFVISSNPSRRFTWDELANLKSAHDAWWKEWWGRSRVTTGDADLDRFYCGQVYLLGAGVRKGKFPPGLYGIWVTTDHPKWHNDFHMNYNYVGTYYGCFAANRCEVADAMPDPLIDYLPQAIRNAKEVLPNLDACHGRKYKNTRVYLDSHPDVANGIDDAAFYPVALGPWGASAEGGDCHWSQVSDGAFQCAVMCTHWEYTLDRAYLKKVWPVLDKTANFFLKWCEKEATPNGGYRYNVWDSHWEGSGLAKNSAPALGCVKHLFETLVDVAPVLREMGIDVPTAKLAAWKDMHEHLSPLAVGVYPINGKPVKMLSGVENADGSANPSGGNAINLESVIPGEQFAFDVTDEFRALATNAVNGNIAISPKRVWSVCNQTPKLFATAIRVGYSPQVIIDAFKKHQLAIMQKNFHIHDGVHGVEKIGAMEFVQSMLIQCDHGYVKVFPNWTGADAKFENLRAKGCFLVSAEMKGGKVVRVEVKSERGGRFRLVDPRQQAYNSKVNGWTRGKTRNSGEITLERDFKPGEVVSLTMTGDCAATAVALSPISFDAPGHVYTDEETPVARGGKPGESFSLVDWRGRPVGQSGTWRVDGTAVLPRMPTGYYRLVSNCGSATFAVVPPPASRVFDHRSFYAIDSAQSWVSSKGNFLCPWNGGDTFRTVSDLIWRMGMPHVRERLSWTGVNPQPDKLDFGNYMYNGDLLRERGILISGLVHDCPPWAAKLQKLPSDLNAVFTFCSKTAAAFGNRMGDWEFWNEQDISFAPEPVWDYAPALKAAYLGLKAGKPDVVVLPGALCQWPDSVYARALFENDAAKFGDVFNYHTYRALADYPRMFATLRAFLARYGAGERAIWMTESGTNLEGHSDKPGAMPQYMAHSPEQELVLAEFYPKSQIAMQMESVARNYYFVFGAYNERGGKKDWGVQRRDGTVKPSYAAMSAMLRELVSTRLLGELRVGEGVRAYVFRQPDGSQTLAYWSVSPLDTQRHGVVSAAPDYAKTFSLPAADGTYRFTDMCGMRSEVAATNRTLTLASTRFPSYVSGLHGLAVDVPALSPGKVMPYVPRADEDLSVIIRVDLDRKDFSISGQKTVAVMNGEKGRMRVQVWNMGDTAKTGTVEVAGGPLLGLPERIVLGPRGTPPATFDCTLAAVGDPSRALELVGVFGGRRSSRFHMSVKTPPSRQFIESCTSVPLACEKPGDWARNTSASSFTATWDEKEKAVRFDVAWDDPGKDRWFYPIYRLKKPQENLAGARLIEFEVKSVQDKVENDFKTQNLMLVFSNGPDRHLKFSVPMNGWEKRYVVLDDCDKLDDVVSIRLGANPLGMKCTFWVRGVKILRAKGCFLVSAEMKGGEATLERDFKPGESAVLHP